MWCNVIVVLVLTTWASAHPLMESDLLIEGPYEVGNDSKGSLKIFNINGNVEAFMKTLAMDELTEVTTEVNIKDLNRTINSIAERVQDLKQKEDEKDIEEAKMQILVASPVREEGAVTEQPSQLSQTDTGQTYQVNDEDPDKSYHDYTLTSDEYIDSYSEFESAEESSEVVDAVSNDWMAKGKMRQQPDLSNKQLKNFSSLKNAVVTHRQVNFPESRVASVFANRVKEELSSPTGVEMETPDSGSTPITDLLSGEEVGTKDKTFAVADQEVEFLPKVFSFEDAVSDSVKDEQKENSQPLLNEDADTMNSDGKHSAEEEKEMVQENKNSNDDTNDTESSKQALHKDKLVGKDDIGSSDNISEDDMQIEEGDKVEETTSNNSLENESNYDMQTEELDDQIQEAEEKKKEKVQSPRGDDTNNKDSEVKEKKIESKNHSGNDYSDVGTAENEHSNVMADKNVNHKDKTSPKLKQHTEKGSVGEKESTGVTNDHGSISVEYIEETDKKENKDEESREENTTESQTTHKIGAIVVFDESLNSFSDAISVFEKDLEAMSHGGDARSKVATTTEKTGETANILEDFTEPDLKGERIEEKILTDKTADNFGTTPPIPSQELSFETKSSEETLESDESSQGGEDYYEDQNAEGIAK